MKKTFYFLGAVIVTLALVTACSDDLSPTRPDLSDVESRWAPERTNAGSTASSAYNVLDTALSFSLSVGSAPVDTDYIIDFSGLKSTTYGIDMLKLDKAAFETKLKSTLIFSSYGDDGDSATAKPASKNPLSYSVIEWKDYKAKIRFPAFTADVSAMIDVQVDPAQFTHHNGIRFDLNNDGIFDEYDTWTKQISLTGGAAGDYPAYNYQRGLLNGSDPLNPLTRSYGWDPDEASPILVLALPISAWDATDYSSLNEFIKLQKFSKEKGWENTGIAGSYDTVDRKLTFTASGAQNGDAYRFKLENYNAAKNFRSGPYNGVPQKLFGTWDPSHADDTIGPFNPTNSPITEIVGIGDAFNTVTGALSSDAYNKNVVYTVALVPGIELPDPNDAIRRGVIKFGHSTTNSLNTANDWNRVVFYPSDRITVETYRNDGEPGAADRWRIIYPPEYKQLTSHYQFVIINNEYKTVDGTKQFGDIGNTNLVLKEGSEFRSFYRPYYLGQF